MKKMTTQLLYVFSFSLLFLALYLNFFHKEKADASFLKTEKKASLQNAVLSENKAVAQPETSTVSE